MYTLKVIEQTYGFRFFLYLGCSKVIMFSFSIIANKHVYLYAICTLVEL